MVARSHRGIEPSWAPELMLPLTMIIITTLAESAPPPATQAAAAARTDGSSKRASLFVCGVCVHLCLCDFEASRDSAQREGLRAHQLECQCQSVSQIACISRLLHFESSLSLCLCLCLAFQSNQSLSCIDSNRIKCECAIVRVIVNQTCGSSRQRQRAQSKADDETRGHPIMLMIEGCLRLRQL